MVRLQVSVSSCIPWHTVTISQFFVILALHTAYPAVYPMYDELSTATVRVCATCKSLLTCADMAVSDGYVWYTAVVCISWYYRYCMLLRVHTVQH